MEAQNEDEVCLLKWRALLVISLVCTLLVVGGILIFSSWYSEQVLENLKGYSARLEEDGFVVESKLLSQVHVESQKEWQFFSDFHSYAKQTGATSIYYDQNIDCLYYLTSISPTTDGTVANIFYYNKVF